MKIEIRTATISDAAEIARVHKNSWLTTYQGIVPDQQLDKIIEYYQSGKSQKFRESLINQHPEKLSLYHISPEIRHSGLLHTIPLQIQAH